MTTNKKLRNSMRIIHRYLGFFLAGIMAMYAVSGTVLIFRDAEFLKKEKKEVKHIKSNAGSNEIGQLLQIRGFKVEKEEGDLVYFENGVYNRITGKAEYTVKVLPVVLDKMTQLHKARSEQPLFFLNIFFAVALLFFVISSFWMFMPNTSIFKKGLYFTLAGVAMTILLIFI